MSLGAAMPSGKTIIIFIIVVFGFVGCASIELKTNLFKELYYDAFGLGPKDTVADFRKASPSFQERWLEKMCNGGDCLHSVDWACGFSTSKTLHSEIDTGWESFDHNVKVCFRSLVRQAPLSDSLGKLRLICGRRYMVFAGDVDASPEGCAKAGGKWGEKVQVYGDEDAYPE